MLTPTLKRVQQARSSLLLDQPFFGVLALSLHVIEDDCPTAWTDGRTLAFSPAFVATLNHAQLVALIAHEVMHCACGHPWRRDSREPKRWNVAADYAINGILDSAKFTLPDGALLDSQYDGRHAEWIYDRLPQQQQGGQGGQGQGGQGAGQPNPQGEVRDAPTGPDADGVPAPSEADWQQHVKAATAAARGHMSGALREQIGEATRAAVDWRAILRRYLQEISTSDYSWTRPNRRYLASGLYLPALHAPECGYLAVAVDTSGSIDTVLLSQFAAEISAIASELQPSRVDVLYCDTKVHRVDSYQRGDHVEMHAIGRGGTSFAPVFEAIAKDGEAPAALVYLTDLDGDFPDAAPDYPVIWAVYGRYGRRAIVPFGGMVECE